MKKMRLSEFISQTLIEIIDGVSGAQEHAKEKKAAINPKHINWSDRKQSHYIETKAVGRDEAPMITPIDFEILLTVNEDDKAQGGIGIFAASLGIGVKGEVSETTEAIHKINFKVMTQLPQQ